MLVRRKRMTQALDLRPQPSTTPKPQSRAWQRFRRNRRRDSAPGSGGDLIARVHLAFGFATRPECASDNQFKPPSVRYWFGTDVHGARLVLSRSLWRADFAARRHCRRRRQPRHRRAVGFIAGYVGTHGQRDDAIRDILYSYAFDHLRHRLDHDARGIAKQWLEAMGSVTLAKFARLIFLFVRTRRGFVADDGAHRAGQVLSFAHAICGCQRALGPGPLRILGRHIIPTCRRGDRLSHVDCAGSFFTKAF